MFNSLSKGLAEISLGEALNLVNPIPVWKVVDEAGGIATTGKHLCFPWSSRGYKLLLVNISTRATKTVDGFLNRMDTKKCPQEMIIHLSLT